MNDKKEDKKTKKAKENAEAEANEENHSENGEAKTNEVRRRPRDRVTPHRTRPADVLPLWPPPQVEAAPEEAKDDAKSE